MIKKLTCKHYASAKSLKKNKETCQFCKLFEVTVPNPCHPRFFWFLTAPAAAAAAAGYRKAA